MNPLPTGFEQLGYGPSFKSTLCDLLERVQLLSDFPRREIETLAPYVGAYKVAPRTVIFTEGGKNNFLCFLADGVVDVIKQQKDESPRKLATIRPGKAIGEMTFLDHQPHSATVVATSEAVVLLLTETGFQRLSEENPRLALKVMSRIGQLLSHRLRQTSGQLVDYL
jgi:CRP-like cAMP-binding protein